MRNDILNTTAFAILGRVGGLFVPLVIAATFGSTRETDVFFLVYGFVLCLTLVIGHLFETVIVPHIAEARTTEADVGVLLGSILKRSTLWLSLLILVAMSAVQPTLLVMTRFDEAAVALAAGLFTVMAPATLLMAWTSTLNGTLNAYHRFHLPALSPIFRTVTLILFVVVFHESMGIWSIAIGFTAGEGMRFLAGLLSFVAQSKHVGVQWSGADIATRFFASATYQLIGFSFLCFIPVVNHLIASWLAPGHLSLNAYAVQLRNIPSLLFTAGVGTVTLSHWANEYSRSGGEFDWSRALRTTGQVTLAAATAAALLITFKETIVSCLLQWGAFPADQLPLVASLFAVLVASLPFDVAALLFVRAIIIMKQDRTYLVLALFKLCLLVLLSSLLVRPHGVFGVALATTLANAVYAIAIFLCLMTQRDVRQGLLLLLGVHQPCPPASTA